jgi:hypothetical protein
MNTDFQIVNCATADTETKACNVGALFMHNKVSSTPYMSEKTIFHLGCSRARRSSCLEIEQLDGHRGIFVFVNQQTKYKVGSNYSVLDHQQAAFSAMNQKKCSEPSREFVPYSRVLNRGSVSLALRDGSVSDKCLPQNCFANHSHKLSSRSTLYFIDSRTLTLKIRLCGDGR